MPLTATSRMVDVGGKAASRRTACTRALIRLPQNVADALVPASGNLADVAGPKGAVFTTAIIAGVHWGKKDKRAHPVLPSNWTGCVMLEFRCLRDADMMKE